MKTKWVKVKDLKIGDQILFNKTFVYVVEIKSDCVMLNKNKDGRGMFHEDMFSHKFKDLDNRVEALQWQKME